MNAGRVVAVLAMFVVTPLFAGGGECKKVNGHFEAKAIPAGQGACPSTAIACVDGSMNGGLHGDYYFVMTGGAYAWQIGGKPSVAFYVGTTTIRDKSTVLTGVDTGTYDLPSEGGSGALATLLTFTGNASGQLQMTSQYSPATRTVNGDFSGTLCTQ